MTNNTYKYTYNEFAEDIDKFCELITLYNPQVILAVARGGVTFGHFIAEKLNIRDLYTLNSIHYEGDKKLDTINIWNIPTLAKNKRVLVVDDIVDSGESMNEIIKILKKKFPDTTFKSGVIFYKPDAVFEPDYKLKTANKWIDFFWNQTNN